MQTLIIFYIVSILSIVASLPSHLNVHGKECEPSSKTSAELADQYYDRYKKAGNYQDMAVLMDTDMQTVLGWSLRRQASNADAVTQSMSEECLPAYVELAEGALRSLRKSTKEENSWHNQGAVCNVAYLIETLPAGNLRDKLYRAMNQVTEITLKGMDGLKPDL